MKATWPPAHTRSLAPGTSCAVRQVFYRSNPAREAFVEMCESSYVQKMTFDSYLYKTGEWRRWMAALVGGGGRGGIFRGCCVGSWSAAAA